MENEIKFSKRDSVFCELKKYCHLSGNNDFIEVTEWTNGEGWDIIINASSGNQSFSLTNGQLDLLNILVKIKD